MEFELSFPTAVRRSKWVSFNLLLLKSHLCHKEKLHAFQIHFQAVWFSNQCPEISLITRVMSAILPEAFWNIKFFTGSYFTLTRHGSRRTVLYKKVDMLKYLVQVATEVCSHIHFCKFNTDCLIIIIHYV